MDIVIIGLVNSLQFKKIGELLKDNKYDVFAIVTIVLAVVADIVLLVSASKNQRIVTYVSLIALVLFIVLSQIFISLGGKIYSTSELAKEERRMRLTNILYYLKDNGIVDISSKKDIKKFKGCAQSYYDEKFSAINSLKNIVIQISKFVLLPIVLAVANYILDADNETMSLESKLLYMGIFLIAVIFVTVSVIIIFDFCKTIIKLKNVKISVLLSDLELLASFNMAERPQTESTNKIKLKLKRKE